MVETTIFKGYQNGKEVWAIRKVYGGDEVKTDFICEVSATPEIIHEYGRQKHVFDNKKFQKKTSA